MYAGAVLTGIYFIISIAAAVHLNSVATPDPVTSRQLAAQSSLGIIGLFGLIGPIIGIVMWLVNAHGVRKGRRWGAITGTVFCGLNVISTLFVVIGATGAPGAKVMSLVVLGVGLAATILLWSAPSRAFFNAFK